MKVSNCVLSLALAAVVGCQVAPPMDKPFARFPRTCVTPDSMAVDSLNRLVITAPNFAYTAMPGALFRIDNPGEKPYKWCDLPVDPETQRCSPMGLAFGKEGELYVVDNQPWTGEAFTKNHGRLLRLTFRNDKLAHSEIIATGFEHPNGIRYRRGRLYVTVSSLSEIPHPSKRLVSGVYSFDVNERNVKITNTKEDRNLIYTTVTENAFCQYGLDGIEFDKKGNLYVGNFGDGKIMKLALDPTGRKVVNETLFAETKFDRTLDPAKPGFLNQALSCPLRTTDGMCFGPDGWLYVADFSNNAIVRVSPNGKDIRFVRRDPDGGAAKGGLNQPGEPIFWCGYLVAANFDAVVGNPDKTNIKTEPFATLTRVK